MGRLKHGKRISVHCPSRLAELCQLLAYKPRRTWPYTCRFFHRLLSHYVSNAIILGSLVQIAASAVVLMT
jgi:hypothetical protein